MHNVDKFSVRKYGNRFRLYRPAYKNSKSYQTSVNGLSPIWDADSSAECTYILECIQKSKLENLKFKEKPNITTVQKTHIDGVVLHGYKTGGSVRVDLVDKDRIVGNTHVFPNGWITDYILGQPSVSGSSSINYHYTGKNLGSQMYDLCEKISGYPRIAHGEFFTAGSTNDFSKKFWQKRAQTHQVLGTNDPTVNIRFAKTKQMFEKFNNEIDYMFDPIFASVCAAYNNQSVDMIQIQQSNQTRTLAWNTLISNKALTSRGLYTQKQVLSVCTKLGSIDNRVQTLSAQELLSEYIDNMLSQVSNEKWDQTLKYFTKKLNDIGQFVQANHHIYGSSDLNSTLCATERLNDLCSFGEQIIKKQIEYLKENVQNSDFANKIV